MSNSNNLFDLEEFNSLYHEKKMSIPEISTQYNTYANKVTRLAKKLGAKLRSRSESQKLALESGRQSHPTKGKLRNEQTKIKISESISKSWDNITDEERERRREISKDNWEKMTDDQKKTMLEKSKEGIRNASKNGSKLELLILEEIIKLGYKTIYHKDHLVGNEKMHIDMVIQDLLVAIEIDGPSHFMPIYGKEKLKKSIKTDQRKNGLLLGGGFNVVRILQKKDVTQKLVRDIVKDLQVVLDKIKNSKKNTLYTIGD